MIIGAPEGRAIRLGCTHLQPKAYPQPDGRASYPYPQPDGRASSAAYPENATP
jgi:hypothetical protein